MTAIERLCACLIRITNKGVWERSQWRVPCDTAKRPVQTDTDLASKP